MKNLYDSLLNESIFSVGKINADTTNKLIQPQIQDIIRDICNPQMGYNNGVRATYENESVTINLISGGKFDLAEFVHRLHLSGISVSNLYIDYDEKYCSIPRISVVIKNDMDFKGLNFIVKPHNGQHNKLFIQSPYGSSKVSVLSNLNIIGGATEISAHNVRFKHCSMSTTSSVHIFDGTSDPLGGRGKNVDLKVDASQFHIMLAPADNIFPSIINKGRAEMKRYVDDTIQDITGGKHHEYTRDHNAIGNLRMFMDKINGYIDPNFWKNVGINVNSPDINIELYYMGPRGDKFIMLFYNKKPQSDVLVQDIMRTKINTKVNGIGNMSVGALVQYV